MTRLGRLASAVLEFAMLAAGAWALAGWWISMVVGSLDPSIAADHRGPRGGRTR